MLVTVRTGQEHTYRSTVAIYDGEYYVPLNKAKRTETRRRRIRQTIEQLKDA